MDSGMLTQCPRTAHYRSQTCCCLSAGAWAVGAVGVTHTGRAQSIPQHLRTRHPASHRSLQSARLAVYLLRPLRLPQHHTAAGALGQLRVPTASAAALLQGQQRLMLGAIRILDTQRPVPDVSKPALVSTDRPPPPVLDISV